jgi:hypothetical protein
MFTSIVFRIRNQPPDNINPRNPASLNESLHEQGDFALAGILPGKPEKV